MTDGGGDTFSVRQLHTYAGHNSPLVVVGLGLYVSCDLIPSSLGMFTLPPPAFVTLSLSLSLTVLFLGIVVL